MTSWKKYCNIIFLSVGGLLLISLILFYLFRGPSDSHNNAVKSPPAAIPASTLILSRAPSVSPASPPPTSFSMGEKIYALLTVEENLTGKHRISFQWINPAGRLQERFDKQLADSRPGYRCWSWIKLSGDEFIPVSIGPFSTKKFLGNWRVDVYLDGNFLTSEKFVVE